MKNIKFNDLNKNELLTQTEPISIEHNGKLVGYYYPAVDHEKVKANPDLITEKVLLDTGLTEDKYLPDSQSGEVKKQVNLGRKFMNEYHETFQELAK